MAEVPMADILQETKPAVIQPEQTQTNEEVKVQVTTNTEAQQQEAPIVATKPSLTYMDFVPTFLNPAVDERSAPEYEPFRYTYKCTRK